jgi:hypothetical protein
MAGEIRVTVIATGFDKSMATGAAARETAAPVTPSKSAPVIPFPQRVARGIGNLGKSSSGDLPRRSTTISPAPPVTNERKKSSEEEQDLTDMEIPTFIRRQMD